MTKVVINWGNVKLLIVLLIIGLVGYHFGGKIGIFMIWGLVLLLEVILIKLRILR